MGEKKIIDGKEYEVKIDGMTLVDNYYVPDADVEEYVRERELYAVKAAEIFNTFCNSVVREWGGSEDGEAIVGRDATGEIIALVHLDPCDLKEMREADAKNELRQCLLEINSLSDDDPRLTYKY